MRSRIRKYQIFVSSTYTDLKEERSEVIQALLESNGIPMGMELFPASNKEQWDFIKKVIADCDIYLVLLAGRYGDTGIDDSGKSTGYTEMEFDFAKSIGKPILAFIHSDTDSIPSNKTEKKNARRLRDFQDKLKKGRMVKFWTNKDNLKSAVLQAFRSFDALDLTDESGWVKASDLRQVNSSRFLEPYSIVKFLEHTKLSADGFVSNSTSVVESHVNGLEVVHRHIIPFPPTALKSLSTTTTNATVFSPPITMMHNQKFFIHLGQPLSIGQIVPIELIEVFTQEGEWDDVNVYGHFTDASLEYLKLEIEFEDLMRPDKVFLNAYSGDVSHNQIIQSTEVTNYDDVISYEINMPEFGVNYVIETLYLKESLRRIEQERNRMLHVKNNT